MSLSFQHLTSISDLSRDDVTIILSKAAEMEKVVESGGSTDLQGKIIASLFYEPSTRTKLSFEAAVQRLGGSVISAVGVKFSSLFKGESLEDTMLMAGQYADGIIMRHPEAGSAKRAAAASTVPFINAGDGSSEHPTQGLLDLYTIQKELGRDNNLHVAFATDPLQSRTIRSLAFLLSMFENITLTFIGPKQLWPAEDLLQHLDTKGVSYTQTEDLKEGLKADVLYMNRLQEERFANSAEFEQLRPKYILTKAMVEGSSVIIMDPLPRVDEIEVAVDALPNAAYFRQVKNGLYIRMALLSLMINGT